MEVVIRQIMFIAMMLLFFVRTAMCDCSDVNLAKQKLIISSTNWYNRSTTKTSEGSFFKRRALINCRRDKCQVKKEPTGIVKFYPQHPDANSKGFVTFPKINPRKELVWATSAAIALKNYAKKGVCNLKIAKDKKGLSSIIYPSDDKSVLRDSFVFNNGLLISWKRIARNGKKMVINFKEN